MTKKRITVFGAGIAGLTAAHELATRGFSVQVIDPDFNEEYDASTLDRGIGGMARSQWAVDPNGNLQGKRLRRLWSGSDLLVDVRLRFADGKPTDERRAGSVLDRLAATYRKLATAGVPVAVIGLRVFGATADTLAKDARVAWIARVLEERGIEREVIDDLFDPAPGSTDLVGFYVRSGAMVPAEHGFRFFPSFYRHLFDTMKRTPIAAPNAWQRTKATTYDNLTPSEGLGFAREGKAVSFMIPRHAMSFEQMRRVLDQVIEQLGYTEADIARFSLKLFKYMTSCTRRREEQYENMSWGEFVEEWRYSKISREHIEFGPQMSAALRGSKSDARTQGNITIQLLMDQLKPGAEADYTLEGPTSSYWLNHWHDFLKAECVEFRRGALDHFQIDGGKIVPVLASGEVVRADGYVLALSLPAMKRVAERFVDVAADREVAGIADMKRVIAFARKTDFTAADPPCPLKHLSGIQYYFDQDVRFWRGHTQYLDSRWGLTSIAQSQFWSRPRGDRDGYRSILSVDIGIFDRTYPAEHGKCVWDCTIDEIADLAWRQIEAGHATAFAQLYGPHAKFPQPIAYSLDGQLEWNKDGHLCGNGAPFLVNETGAYPKRPGAVDRAAKNVSRYPVIGGAYVMAGTFMQTFTRLTSMEGANESARHAVNALLDHFATAGDRCQIWDPEDHEVDDLQWFKDLDAKLYKHRMPHFTDILGWDELPDDLQHVRAMANVAAGGRA